MHAKKSPWRIFIPGLALLGLFWLLNVWVIGGSAVRTEPEEAVRAEARIKNLADLRAENQVKLESYAWVDRAKGKVQIPIAEAMRLVIFDLNSARPHVPATPTNSP